MGYAFKGICYATAQEANDVHFESVSQFFEGSVQLHYQRDASGNWYLQQGTYASNGAYTLNFSVPAISPVFATCSDPSSPSEYFSDGMTLGWGIVAAMVLAWGLWVLRKST